MLISPDVGYGSVPEFFVFFFGLHSVPPPLSLALIRFLHAGYRTTCVSTSKDIVSEPLLGHYRQVTQDRCTCACSSAVLCEPVNARQQRRARSPVLRGVAAAYIAGGVWRRRRVATPSSTPLFPVARVVHPAIDSEGRDCKVRATPTPCMDAVTRCPCDATPTAVPL